MFPIWFGIGATAWLAGLISTNTQTWEEGNYQYDPDAWYTDPNSPGYWKKGGVGYESGEKPPNYYSNDSINQFLSETDFASPHSVPRGKYGRKGPMAVMEGQPTLYDQWLTSKGRGYSGDYWDSYGAQREYTYGSSDESSSFHGYHLEGDTFVSDEETEDQCYPQYNLNGQCESCCDDL